MLVCQNCRGTQLSYAGYHDPLYLCRGCGLIEHRRSSNQESEEARYQEILFESSREVARQQWDWLTERVPREKLAGRLLDYGCGGGTFLEVARSHGLAVSGCDISPRAIEQVQLRLGPEVETFSGASDDLPFESGFDLITLWDVLDHLEVPQRSLLQLGALLNPGGYLVVRVRNGPFHLLLRNLEQRFRNILRLSRNHSSLGVIHRYGLNRALLTQYGVQAGLTFVSWGTSCATPGNLRRSGSDFQPSAWLKRLYFQLAERVGQLSDYQMDFSPSLLAFFEKRSG